MKMNIFGREADFDQLAIACANPEYLMNIIGGDWSSDHVSSKVKLWGMDGNQDIEFNLFYNYQQQIPFKELELIQFLSYHNFHSFSDKNISPMGMYAPSLRPYLDSVKKGFAFISHIGIHCSEEEGQIWRAHFLNNGILVAHEDWSYKHTNPAVAGKRTYHNIIFKSREALGFDFKACIRVPV